MDDIGINEAREIARAITDAGYNAKVARQLLKERAELERVFAELGVRTLYENPTTIEFWMEWFSRLLAQGAPSAMYLVDMEGPSLANDQYVKMLSKKEAAVAKLIVMETCDDEDCDCKARLEVLGKNLENAKFSIFNDGKETAFQQRMRRYHG